jgi:hypothetical protein
MTKNFLFYLLIPVVLLSACHREPEKYSTWSVYGGSKDNIHYSALRQIDTDNVSQLRPAWEYHTGDADSNSQIQVNSIIVDSTLYGVSPRLKIFALDAATGKLKWSFDPARPDGGAIQKIAISACRGIAYYRGSAEDQRLFYSASSSLYCIDALTGHPISSFGENGMIDLHHDLGRDVKDLYVAGTTPGIIYKDLLIVGDRVAEEADAAPVTFGLMTYTPAVSGGSFIPFPIPARKAIPPGRTRRRISISVAPIAGQASASMRIKASFSRLSDRPVSISMAAAASVTISSPIACWHWMRLPAGGYGIIKPCITISGTVIPRRRRYR